MENRFRQIRIAKPSSPVWLVTEAFVTVHVERSNRRSSAFTHAVKFARWQHYRGMICLASLEFCMLFILTRFRWWLFSCDYALVSDPFLIINCNHRDCACCVGVSWEQHYDHTQIRVWSPSFGFIHQETLVEDERNRPKWDAVSKKTLLTWTVKYNGQIFPIFLPRDLTAKLPDANLHVQALLIFFSSATLECLWQHIHCRDVFPLPSSCSFLAWQVMFWCW